MLKMPDFFFVFWKQIGLEKIKMLNSVKGNHLKKSLSYILIQVIMYMSL